MISSQLLCNLTLTFEEPRYIFQLWDIVLSSIEEHTVTEMKRANIPVTTVLHKKRKNMIVFLAGMSWVQLGELTEYSSPTYDNGIKP